VERDVAYVVIVADNFHYMDPEEHYKSGEFTDAQAALQHCRQIVDAYLDSAHHPGISAEGLFNSYMNFGEDPFINSIGAPRVEFSAWDYARKRCAELAARFDANSQGQLPLIERQ